VLDAGFGDLPRKTLRNLDRLGYRSALGNQARDVGAGRNKSALLKRLNMKLDSRFCHHAHCVPLQEFPRRVQTRGSFVLSHIVARRHAFGKQ